MQFSVRVRPNFQWAMTCDPDADVKVLYLLGNEAVKRHDANGTLRLFIAGKELLTGRPIKYYLSDDPKPPILVNGVIVKQQQQQQQQLIAPVAHTASPLLSSSSGQNRRPAVGSPPVPLTTPTPPPLFVNTGPSSPQMGLEHGRQWRIENFSNGDVVIPRRQLKMKHGVFVARCNRSIVSVPRTVSKITLYELNECRIVCHGALASLELIRCRQIQIVVTESVPLCQIDMSFGIRLFFSEKAILNCRLITASSEDVWLSSWPPPPPAPPASNASTTTSAATNQEHPLLRALTPPPEPAHLESRSQMTRSEGIRRSGGMRGGRGANAGLHTYFVNQTVPCSLFGDQLVSWVEGRGPTAQLRTLTSQSLKDSGGYLLVANPGQSIKSRSRK